MKKQKPKTNPGQYAAAIRKQKPRYSTGKGSAAIGGGAAAAGG